MRITPGVFYEDCLSRGLKILDLSYMLTQGERERERIKVQRLDPDEPSMHAFDGSRLNVVSSKGWCCPSTG